MGFEGRMRELLVLMVTTPREQNPHITASALASECQ